MYQPSFKAILKTPEGKLLEYGHCIVCAKTKSADFKSRFVPLFKVGTIIRIYRVIGKSEVSFYEGTIYLSSQNFLRIVDINETVINSSFQIVQTETTYEGTFTPHFTSLTDKIKYINAPDFLANIYSIGKDKIKFLSTENSLLKGQKLLVNFDKPFVTNKIIIQIYEKICCGDIQTGYLCNIIHSSDDDKNNLNLYCSKLNELNISLL